MTIEFPMAAGDSAARHTAPLAERLERTRDRDLLHRAVLTLLFSSRFAASLVPYPYFMRARLIFWNFFTKTTRYGTWSSPARANREPDSRNQTLRPAAVIGAAG